VSGLTPGLNRDPCRSGFVGGAQQVPTSPPRQPFVPVLLAADKPF